MLRQERHDKGHDLVMKPVVEVLGGGEREGWHSSPREQPVQGPEARRLQAVSF